ncbi:DUF721 domain-containing protein [Paenalcaligenes niemegkensis]|uniref:DciA family protein n=1 Tax=Paenalcaligenes niemegkensis TaxID=2895469 RepID=UPI001EE916DE|nr:DciA family protein [Paenalcaligenes niemegkensis]MCQ9615897.1 DUF721 domain-containing protein [Paenalcaligenes niemegkensis]
MTRHYFKKNPSRSKKPAELAISWLGNDQQGSHVLDTARAYLAAERIIANVLTGALGRECKVAHIEGQHLTLAVPSPAHAAKLRQLAPTVLRTLNQDGWNLSEISVQVQAALYKSVINKAPREIKAIDANAIEAFKTLQASLAPGALADAVAKLVKNHS